MTGFVAVTSACLGCGQLFSYHPNKVPNVRVEGVRQPICLNCVDRVNPRRIANGLEPIRPQEGAYEAAPESEVIWEDYD